MYLAPFPYTVYRMHYTMDSLHVHVPSPIPIQCTLYIECIILWIPYMYMYLAPFPYNVYRMQYTNGFLTCTWPHSHTMCRMQYTRDSLPGPIPIQRI